MSRTAPTAAALRAHERRVAAMLADPECVGELLLVGLVMARSLDLGDPGWVDGRMPMNVIAERVYGDRWLPGPLLHPGRFRADPKPWRRWRDVFHADRRRYDPERADRSGPFVLCGRSMIRRDGLCGRNATGWRMLTDPSTGERSRVGACGRKLCKRWFAGLVERNRAELNANPPPVPPANTGGVLERHLPEIDWWKVWHAVDERWAPPPEGRAFEQPTLQLIVGDDEPEVLKVAGSRPALTVLPGGWR